MTRATVTVDRDGTIVSWDAGAEELLGHPAGAVIGRKVDVIVPEPFREAHWQGFHRAMARPEIKDLAADMPVLCADGTVREFAGRLLVLSDGLGSAFGAMGIYVDDGIQPASVRSSSSAAHDPGLPEEDDLRAVRWGAPRRAVRDGPRAVPVRRTRRA